MSQGRRTCYDLNTCIKHNSKHEVTVEYKNTSTSLLCYNKRTIFFWKHYYFLLHVLG